MSATATINGQSSLLIGDVCRRLRTTPNTVYGLVRAGRLVAFKVGRSLRFTADDVDRYVAQHRTDHKEQTAE